MGSCACRCRPIVHKGLSGGRTGASRSLVESLLKTAGGARVEAAGFFVGGVTLWSGRNLSSSS